MIPVLPVTYCGNLEYYYYLLKNNSVVIDTKELYVKQTYRNRCEILGPNGQLNLSVPVERPYGKQTKTESVLISYSENWWQIHWKTLESCYNRSPYFEFYADQLKTILYNNHKTLTELNLSLTQFFTDKVGIDCSILATPPETNELNDLRQRFNPKKKTNFRNYTYLQTFTEKYGHIGNLSIMDLLFNEGPNSICILEESTMIKEL